MGVFAYAKIGRAIGLTQDRWGFVGGDNEPPRLLDSLARSRPNDTWVIISPCADDPQACGFPPNVVNIWTPERSAWLRDEFKRRRIAERIAECEGEAELDVIREHESLLDALLLPLVPRLDGVVVWAGQHGTANSVLPAVTDRSGVAGFTRPYDSFVKYAGGIMRLINAWRDLDPVANEEVWLIADARNYLKARDLKWPALEPVLGQYVFERNGHHERFGDARDPKECGFTKAKAKWKTDHTWSSKYHYAYSRLEICGILPQHCDIETDAEFETRDLRDEWSARRSFGLFINEAGAVGQEQIQRRAILPEWVLPLEPAFVHGKWGRGHEEALGRLIEPAPWEDYYPLLKSVRSTFTTPSSCSGWATTKPWEAFGAGTVCFKHPSYDDQSHIYGDFTPEQREWLCPKTPEDLAVRVKALDNDFSTWAHLVTAQRRLYDYAVEELRHVRMIEERLGGSQ